MLPAGWFQYAKVIDTADLPDDKQAAVSSIKQGRNGIEVKLHDKPRALEMLGKYLGLFDNGAAPPAQSNNLFDAIVGGTGEDMETDGISELEQETEAGGDVVEPAEV
jgi:phage terminase small subunit